MKDDEELEMLLGEIPHATSSLSLHPTLTNNAHHQHHNNVVDHGHASCVSVTQKSNGHAHGMYGDEFFKHKSACGASDGCSSSMFSVGNSSVSNIGSPSPPRFEPHLSSGNNRIMKANGSRLVDDFTLSRSFNKMYISGEHDGFSVSQNGGRSCDPSLNETIRMNLGAYGAASDNYMREFSNYGGFNTSVPGMPMSLGGEVDSALVEMQNDQRIANGLFSRSNLGNSALSPQFYGTTSMLANNNIPMGIAAPNLYSASNKPSAGDNMFYAPQNAMNLVEASDAAFYSPNLVQLARLMPLYNDETLLHYQPPLPNGRNKVPLRIRAPQGSFGAYTNDDGLILHGDGVNYGMNRAYARSRGQNAKSFYHEKFVGKPQEKRSQLDGRLHMDAAFSPPSKYSSLAEAQGYIYHIAKDQHGCRFLQRMFDEGTSQDVQLIFNEIIDHVVELMMNPFGNYLMQKLLEVCNEEQRMHILLRVTEEPGELVRISLNTHGTRVVQKLIETLKTRQQISLAISALEPGFLALIKDLNGNHVVQRCLQCFTNEDSKFIFVAAAKYCVDIATHQHGCCVLQRCISHSTGEHRENLVAQISANGLLLAQDAFGNYVVQFILELKIPSETSKLTSQFEGNYVHLSTQKFSSHVVEKCLVVCNDEVQSKIIHELLSATYFEQLLQDPHANYVVQTALRASEGPVHDSLVDAIESYKAVSRNSPYAKRIFSHKLLKR